MTDFQVGRPGAAPVDAVAWLSRRDGEVPDSLRIACRAALSRVGDRATVADALAEAASICLARAIEAGSDRSAAGPLLAADALLTWAMEAAVEESLPADTFAVGVAGRLTAMLEPT